jgi:hypothetical protein
VLLKGTAVPDDVSIRAPLLYVPPVQHLRTSSKPAMLILFKPQVLGYLDTFSFSRSMKVSFKAA